MEATLTEKLVGLIFLGLNIGLVRDKALLLLAQPSPFSFHRRISSPDDYKVPLCNKVILLLNIFVLNVCLGTQVPEFNYSQYMGSLCLQKIPVFPVWPMDTKLSFIYNQILTLAFR